MRITIKQLLLLGSSILLASCSTGGSDNDKKAGDGSTEIHVSVADARAGWVENEIRLAFKGLPVVDESGEVVTEKTVSPEKASDVVLKVKSLPESDTDLIILGSAEGYLSSGTSVVVSPKAGERSATLKLVKDEPGEVADGVFSAQEEIGDHVDKNGVVTSEITLESRASAADPGLKVTIPQGITMTDADGQPVKGSVLKVVSFDPRKPAALAAYPGGMNVLAAVDGFTGFDGTPASGKRQVNFKTAGFAVIQIEGDDGRKVRHFSSDIEIAMQFPEGTTDAEGHVIGAGDPVPIWSFSETTGEWRFEKNGTAADLTPNDGLIDVVYNTDHLTAWNLDWHYGDVCTANVNVIDTLGVNQLALVNHFIVSIPTAPIYRNLYNSNPADGNLLLFNVPVGHQATVTAYDINGTVLGSVTVDDLCGGNVGTGGWNTNVDNEVDLIIDSDTTPVNVSFTASCPTAGMNVPGFNSNTVPLPLVLSNGTSISLPNGTGQVGGGTWNLSPLPSNPTLFNAIDWANGGNPPIPQVSISGTSFNQDLQLSNAFCSPTSGQIDGAGCGGATTGLTFFVPGSAHGNPRDVVKDKEGNLYVSTDENGILKRDVNGNGGFTVFVAGGTSNYPSATPSASNDEVSEVTAGWPYGMDLIAAGGHEYLYYVDRTGHCVNVIQLDSNQVSTVVGQCGQPGNVFSSNIDNVNATDGKIDTPYDIDVFSAPAGLIKYISAKGRILMVNTDDYLWHVAGTGSETDTNYTNGADALTTPMRPYMVAVNSLGQPVFSEYYAHRVTRIEGLSLSGLNPLAGGSVTLQKVTGLFGSPGNSGDTGPATAARLRNPADVEYDNNDNLLIADMHNYKVRRIDNATATIDTVAGTGNPWWDTGSNACGPATQRNLHRPHGLWIENNGDFYITQASWPANAGYRFIRHVTY